MSPDRVLTLSISTAYIVTCCLAWGTLPPELIILFIAGAALCAYVALKK